MVGRRGSRLGSLRQLHSGFLRGVHAPFSALDMSSPRGVGCPQAQQKQMARAALERPRTVADQYKLADAYYFRTRRPGRCIVGSGLFVGIESGRERNDDSD